jgi:uncharacterized Zn finger protein (UPF0148 family)
MGTTPASPEDRASSGQDRDTPQAEAVETNIPCGHCPDGILLIRDDGYVYCPACDHERPPQRGRAAHTASSDTSTVAEHRSRYPERIDDTDLFVPKVELAATRHRRCLTTTRRQTCELTTACQRRRTAAEPCWSSGCRSSASRGTASPAVSTSPCRTDPTAETPGW